MNDPSDPTRAPSAIETLEARSRQLSQEPAPRAPDGRAPKVGGDGCAKGCLIGSGCFAVLVLVALIAVGFGVNRLAKTYLVSPEPMVLEPAPAFTEAERQVADRKLEKIRAASASSQAFEESFSDAELTYLIEKQAAVEGGRVIVRFPEDDHFEVRTSIPTLGGYVNAEIAGTARVEHGMVEVEIERIRMRDIDWAPEFVGESDQGLYAELDLAVDEGLRSLVIRPGEISIRSDPNEPRFPENFDEPPEDAPGPGASAPDSDGDEVATGVDPALASEPSADPPPDAAAPQP